jgi:hypothetical protein
MQTSAHRATARANIPRVSLRARFDSCRRVPYGGSAGRMVNVDADEGLALGIARIHAARARGRPIVAILAGTAAGVAIFTIVPMLTTYVLLDLDHLKLSQLPLPAGKPS